MAAVLLVRRICVRCFAHVQQFFWLSMLYSYLSVSCGSMHRKSRAPPKCAHSASHVCHKLNTDTHTYTHVDMELLVLNWGQNKMCVN